MDGLLDYIRRACMLHDTPVALAFRRALGMGTHRLTPMEPKAHAAHGVYDGMRECFANERRVRL